MEINFIFELAILIISIIFHELSHGYVAYFLGDPTAKYAGRLTLNPIKHADLFGSIIVPIITTLLPGGIVFGWAKPVPVNPYNLRAKKWGEAIVAFAGPLSNILIALVFSVIIRLIAEPGMYPTPTIILASYVVMINVVLAFFNLMPVPPLDGSKILYSLLPLHAYKIRNFLERFSLIIVFVFIFALWPLVAPVIPVIFRFLTGI